MLRCTGLSHEILRRTGQRGCTTTRVITRHTALGSACVWRVSRARSLRGDYRGAHGVHAGHGGSPRGRLFGLAPRACTGSAARLCVARARADSISTALFIKVRSRDTQRLHTREGTYGMLTARGSRPCPCPHYHQRHHSHRRHRRRRNMQAWRGAYPLARAVKRRAQPVA